MKIIKFILLPLILLCLAISPVQMIYPLVTEMPLKGFFDHPPAPELKFFTWQRWFSSVFQDEFSKRINDYTGFRISMIRLNNQSDYSLFGLTHALGFLEGKEQYLFEEDYIHEYTGKYFIGTKVIDRKLSRLKNVMDSLAAYKIPLILVFEPGKASFYPEYIPDRFHPEKRSKSNYTCFAEKAEALGLTCLDLNRYFLQMKDTAKFPLFSRYGMHWSLYGAHLAADKLSQYIGTVTGRKMPAFQHTKLHHSPNSLGTDYDIGEMLNLVCPLPPTPGVYPLTRFDTMAQGTLAGLIVADSYYVNMVESYGRKMFGRQDYWYYYSSEYPHQNDFPPVKLDKSDLRAKLQKYNVILLMVSEINLHCCFWNFADEAYLAFHPEVQDSQLDKIENSIRIDREWFRFMVKKSREQQLPLDEMIRTNAEYTFSSNYDNLPGKTYWDSIQHLILTIRGNAEWYAQITKNARDQHMSLDTALMLNAIYSYSQSKNK
ncbi:MAG: hypothetical protein NTW16_16455 [Bacteroidetes bacterium]|nr:hypothetical protein [Bacteroidota bacterium]